MKIGDRTFRETWAVDFEFTAHDGEPPEPLCMVARRIEDGQTLRVWRDQLLTQRAAPFATDAESLIVAYYAGAEMGCFLQLGWPVPEKVLDLFAEFRNATNGLPTFCGAGLLGALAYYGLDGLAAAEKEGMRALALRGGPYTNVERTALIEYCESDVRAVEALLMKMRDGIDLPRALLRGRYMIAAARIETTGVPIDLPLFERVRDEWHAIQDQLVARIDADYSVFDGRAFKADRWARWLAANAIPWPRLASGALALDDDTFREMARVYPSVAPVRELRYALSQMRLADLAVGADGRNRYTLSAFRSKTGRNQPSNTRSIFGPAVWIRGLIQPDPWDAIAYVDWAQQEFGIAAALSQDAAMIAAYESGDPYLAFAKQAGAVPADATKATHNAVREQYKACVLAVQYGMGAESLALRIGQSPAVARELLRQHRETYRRFWEWSYGAVSYAMLRGQLHTAFGWRVQAGTDVNPRMLANFPMQANGAEMLRLACIFATERGIRVCAPVHDALLIEAPAWQIDEVVSQTQLAMADASAAVLPGFRLRTDARVFAAPARYFDERGQRMWDTVQAVLADLPPVTWGTGAHPTGSIGAHPVQSLLCLFNEEGRLDAEPAPERRSTAADERAAIGAQTVVATAASEARRPVPERADSLDLAVQRLVASRPSRCGRRGAVVPSGDHAQSNGQHLVPRPGRDGHESVCRPTWVASAGSGAAGQHRAAPRPSAGSDDPGRAVALAAWPAEWRELFEERAAIIEFDGRTRRRNAEIAALAEISAQMAAESALLAGQAGR